MNNPLSTQELASKCAKQELHLTSRRVIIVGRYRTTQANVCTIQMIRSTPDLNRFLCGNLQRFVNSANDSSGSSLLYKTLGHDTWFVRVSHTSLLYPVRSSPHIGSHFRRIVAAPSRLSSRIMLRSCTHQRCSPSAQCTVSQ